MARKNAMRVQEAQASKALKRFSVEDVDPKLSPVEAMLREFRRTVAVVEYLDSLVMAEGFEDVVAGGQQLGDYKNPLLGIWQEERDRQARIITSMHRMGIAEQQLELEKAKVQTLAGALVRVLAAMPLTQEDRLRGLAMLKQELMGATRQLDGAA